MANSSQSGIARFLKFSGIVQVISMIIVAVFIASAYFIYKDDFRGWDRLENSYLGTPEPLTSMVFFMFGLAALWFMMPIKIYLGRLPLTHVSKARKTLTFITILGLCIVATVVAVFAELIGLVGAAIAADWAGGIFFLAVFLCVLLILAVIIDLVLLVIYMIRWQSIVTLPES